MDVYEQIVNGKRIIPKSVMAAENIKITTDFYLNILQKKYISFACLTMLGVINALLSPLLSPKVLTNL